MAKKPQNSKTLQRVLQLQEKRRNILRLPPEKALDRILSDPQPAALVHSFPEQDFYLLVNEIGPQDSLPLLSLATNKQWEHIADLETWQKDRIDLKMVTRWLSLLLEADSKRFIHLSSCICLETLRSEYGNMIRTHLILAMNTLPWTMFIISNSSIFPLKPNLKNKLMRNGALY
jgi:hypothetical protein